MADSLALYIHFPFCLSICPYCDFDRQATGFDRIDVYLETVERELAIYAECTAERVHSVFFGGGTPSLMRPEQVARLLEAAHRTFDVLPVDDDLAEMYTTTREQLAAAGFEQYEISNWARPGAASRHNLTYWRDESWIGVGAGAASSYGGRRWKNSPVLERYIGSMQRG